MKIAVGEICGCGRRSRNFVRGDDRVRFTFVQSDQEFFPRPCLDIARRRQFQADGARQIDVEANEHAVFVVEIEWRKIAVGQKSNDDAFCRLL